MNKARERATILRCAKVSTQADLRALQEVLANPDWDDYTRWGAYIPEAMQEQWENLPFMARVAAYLVAEDWAQFGRDREDV